MKKRKLGYHDIDLQKDVEALARFTLRKADFDELMGMFSGDPYIALVNSIIASGPNVRKCIDEDTGEILAIWGVASTNYEKEGHPWLLLSEDGEGYMMQFGRRTRAELLKLSEQYDLLYNIIGESNHSSQKFVEWLGFRVNRDNPFSILDPGYRYYTFYMDRREQK